MHDVNPAPFVLSRLFRNVTWLDSLEMSHSVGLLWFRYGAAACWELATLWRSRVAFGKLTAPGETEVSSAGEQLTKGYLGEAHRNDALGRGTDRSTPTLTHHFDSPLMP